MTDSLDIAFLGDVYVGGQSVPPETSLGLRQMLSSCDHVVANLEGPITYRDSPIHNKGTILRQSKSVLDLLKALNVDIVGLANNHISDHGAEGIADTLEFLRAGGFALGGAGMSMEEVYRPVRVKRGDTRLSLLFAGENGFGCVSDARNGQSGYAWQFHRRFKHMVQEEADASDFVAVFLHGGVEDIDRPLPQWREAYRELVEAGASAVVAHHPHLAQGYELYRSAPIFYSIGNFHFDKPSPHQHCYHGQLPILHFEIGSPVTYQLHHSCFTLGYPGRVQLDDHNAAMARSKQLAAELTSSTYAELIAADLRSLWQSRYLPQLDRSLNTLTSARSAARFLRRLMRVAVRADSFTDPEALEYLLTVESHRWAIVETMRALQHETSRAKC